MPHTTTTQRITELKSDHIYTANKNSTNVATGTNTNCFTSNTAKSVIPQEMVKAYNQQLIV